MVYPFIKVVAMNQRYENSFSFFVSFLFFLIYFFIFTLYRKANIPSKNEKFQLATKKREGYSEANWKKDRLRGTRQGGKI